MRRSRALATVVMPLTVLLVAGTAGPAGATGTVAYNTIQGKLPPNVPSQGFQAGHIAQLGDEVILAKGTGRKPQSVKVTMSDWALQSDYPSWPVNSDGDWVEPMTLNIYTVDHSTATPAVGALILSVTENMPIPWRPPANPNCADTSQWKASNGLCYSGIAFNVTFKLGGIVTVPSDIIIGIVYNTETFGPQPYNQPGPYISLNMGFSTIKPSAGTDPNRDDLFQNTNVASNYADGGAGGVGTFREDTAWAPYQPAFKVTV